MLVGQVFYREAADACSTGIGCYFDDPAHEVLGLADNQFQSLYHSSSASRSKTIACRPGVRIHDSANPWRS